MKINDLEFSLVETCRVDTQQPVRSVLVRLTTDSGMEGWGEAAIGWRAGELAARRDAMLPLLVGRNVFDIEELHAAEPLGSAPLRCALEMAFWDLAGRTTGQPLCHLFGGGYRRWIPLAVRLFGDSAERTSRVARELADQGFHCQIVTAGGQMQDDLQALRAVGEAVGDRAELRLDGATRYDGETAAELCAEIEAKCGGVQCLLDPLDSGELYDIATLGRRTRVPLGIWRTIGAPGDVLAVVRSGAARCVVLDLGKVGGMVPLRNCAAVAAAGRISALLCGEPSLGIATAAMLQLAASTPTLSGSNECAYHQLQDDVLVEPLEIVDGMMAVPQGPGLGIEVDRAKVERYRVT